MTECKLNVEIVNGLKLAHTLMSVNVPSCNNGERYVEWVECRDRLESLIKKYDQTDTKIDRSIALRMNELNVRMSQSGLGLKLVILDSGEWDLEKTIKRH